MTENSPQLEPIKCYGITITFKKPLELSHKPFHQYNYTRVFISKILGQSCVDFRIIPEFTVAGRIHYHGILKIRKFPKWIKDTLPSLRKLGFCKIENFKKPENMERWTTYMYKSLDDTKTILGIKDSPIEVTMEDYKIWKQQEPTIEKFVGKPKIVAQPSKKASPICQISDDQLPMDAVLDYIDENNVYHFYIPPRGGEIHK